MSRDAVGSRSRSRSSRRRRRRRRRRRGGPEEEQDIFCEQIMQGEGWLSWDAVGSKGATERKLSKCFSSTILKVNSKYNSTILYKDGSRFVEAMQGWIEGKPDFWVE